MFFVTDTIRYIEKTILKRRCDTVSPIYRDNFDILTHLYTIDAADFTGRLVSTEDELVVMVPSALLSVHPGFYVAAGVVCTRTAGTDHLESGVQQGVECLLEERVFEEESGRVTTTVASIHVAALVQRITEHLAAQRHPSSDQDTPQLPKLHVRDAAVAAEGEGAAVSDHDKARLATSGKAGQVRRLGGIGDFHSHRKCFEGNRQTDK